MGLLSGRSIAVRLAVSSLFWSSLLLLVAGLILSTLYLRSTELAFDERLLVYANDLAADLVPPGNAERDLGSHGDPRFEIPLSGWYWQVGRVDAPPRSLKSSRSLLGNPLPMLAEPVADRPFGDIRKRTVAGPEGRLLRIVERDIDLGEEGRFVVRVAGPADEISDAFNRFVAALVLTFLLLGAGLGVSTLLQIRFGLRPLSKLRRAVAQVRRGEAERIRGRYPGDIAPLAEELNLLLEANREILERARTQVGNLAHALKTPLSVLLNEAEGRAGDLSALVREQAALMRHQVDYYLNRARAAALARTLGAVTEVAPALEALTRTFGKIYRERDLTIEVQAPAGIRFRGERQDLEEMVGNLIDNACKWARTTVQVKASLLGDGDRRRLCLEVSDDGPGVPESARAKAMKRGHRLDEGKPGSGLGLSIVVDIAGHYGGRLDIRTSLLGGAKAVLELPGDTVS